MSKIIGVGVKFGAHLSIAGGYKNALEKIVKIGGNCLQIFSTSPRGWKNAVITADIIDEFKSLKEKLQIDPIYFHASYLINLANPSSGGHLSKVALVHELNAAYSLGVKGSIVHLGSYKTDGTGGDYETLIKQIKYVLEKTPKQTLFIIENSGTRKIGRTLEEISKIIKDLNSDRVKVCLDTCHLHASGYDLSTKAHLDKFLKDFDNLIGIDRLESWHINDSRDEFGSGRDRHENIGEGKIGKETFGLILNHPDLKQMPFIIETPGFDQEGPDKKNLDILKSLLS